MNQNLVRDDAPSRRAITKADAAEAIRKIIHEREDRRKNAPLEYKREEVRNMNRILDVLRFAEDVLIAQEGGTRGEDNGSY